MNDNYLNAKLQIDNYLNVTYCDLVRKFNFSIPKFHDVYSKIESALDGYGVTDDNIYFDELSKIWFDNACCCDSRFFGRLIDFYRQKTFENRGSKEFIYVSKDVFCNRTIGGILTEIYSCLQRIGAGGLWTNPFCFERAFKDASIADLIIQLFSVVNTYERSLLPGVITGSSNIKPVEFYLEDAKTQYLRKLSKKGLEIDFDDFQERTKGLCKCVFERSRYDNEQGAKNKYYYTAYGTRLIVTD